MDDRAQHVGVTRSLASHTNELARGRYHYDGVFLVTLTDEGLCDSFREWWHTRGEKL